jgi:hypothetical protein
MKKGIIVDGLLLILAAFLIICSAPAMAGKIDPLLVALRAQQKDTAKVFIGSDDKEYISSPIPLSNLKDIMDISDDKGELTVYTWYPTQRVGLDRIHLIIQFSRIILL